MVADFMIDGNWNELNLGQELPSSIANDILQIQIYKEHDKIIWTVESNGNLKELCTKIERANPVLNINFIKWREPHDNYLKLNTDGCSEGSPGEAGGGGILRDH
ncbi:hypothetical protein KY285_009934 [Solanum tuberosum]|nr:hypothetical protein KY285_009934 [Solanum tuberosum]